MRIIRNAENWSLILLFASLALAYALCFAPGHRHVFGDMSDPISMAVEVIMILAVIAEIKVLSATQKRRSNG